MGGKWIAVPFLRQETFAVQTTAYKRYAEVPKNSVLISAKLELNGAADGVYGSIVIVDAKNHTGAFGDQITLHQNLVDGIMRHSGSSISEKMLYWHGEQQIINISKVSVEFQILNQTTSPVAVGWGAVHKKWVIEE